MAQKPSSYTLEELRAAPVPSFAEQDTKVITKDLVAKFEAATGRVLYPAQPEMFTINLMAYVIALFGAGIQNGVMQNRAVWAIGGHLDDKGADVGTYRLKAQFARATVRFTLSETRTTSVIIPAGSRIAAGSALVFRTEDELVIPAGQPHGDVSCIAAAPGKSFNDLQPGQIQDILDPVAYVASVANTVVTAGGSDVESDEAFRERVTNALEMIGAGSREYYRALVRAFSPNVIDVEVARPSPGVVEITPLMVDGVASDAVDAAILDHLDPETMRPQGDDVVMGKAVAATFDVAMTLKVAPGLAATVEATAAPAIRARFDAWGAELGAQVAPTALVEDVRAVSGVVGVTGPAFEFTDLPGNSFAVLGNLALTIEEAPNV